MTDARVQNPPELVRVFEQPFPPQPDTPRAELEAALAKLQAKKQEWADLPVRARIEILDQIHKDLPTIEDRWVAIGMAAKGSRPRTMAEGEEWFALTVMYRYLRYLRKTLVDIERHGQPRLPGKLCWKDAGYWRVELVPQNWHDRLSLLGIRAEARIKDNYKGDVPAMATFYQQENPVGKVALVLGAGNVASLPAGDFLNKLFVEGQVVIFKSNPVNSYLGDLLEEGFRALVEPGYLQIVHGGSETGAYLSQHPLVDEVHLTGSDRTYEAVTFGLGDEGRQRKFAKSPILHKRFTAELGNISPVIIVPGPWTKRDIRKQAEKYGTALIANAGFSCVTPRMFIQMKGWEKREAFNAAIADYLSSLETRQAYYPGAENLHAEFTKRHPDALQLGEPKAGELPWTFIPEVDPSNRDDICFKREAFLGLFGETAIDADGVVDFIGKAVAFANENLWGTLCASIVVHPRSMKDPFIAAAVEKAIADLRYGSVVVNHWGAIAYYMAVTPWGAYPGHDMYDIQSGIGKVHNPLMFAEAEKSVTRAPFISIPDPYTATATRSYSYYRRDTRYQHEPSVRNLLKLLWAAALS
jgi:acyl-CoA reductase-like NAD-dependent aldehyde dehydrogenase